MHNPSLPKAFTIPVCFAPYMHNYCHLHTHMILSSISIREWRWGCSSLWQWIQFVKVPLRDQVQKCHQLGLEQPIVYQMGGVQWVNIGCDITYPGRYSSNKTRFMSINPAPKWAIQNANVPRIESLHIPAYIWAKYHYQYCYCRSLTFQGDNILVTWGRATYTKCINGLKTRGQ